MSENRRVFIYVLCSSEDGEIRYCGQSWRTPAKRLWTHYRDARKGKQAYVNRWIRDVLDRGHEVLMTVVEQDAVLHESEKNWIALLRSQGARLTNLTDGGEGNHGYKWTPEQLAMISAKRKGRVITDEWRRNISAGGKDKKKPPGFGEKVSRGLTGIQRSEETKRKLADMARGRRFIVSEDGRRRSGELKRQWWAERKAAGLGETEAQANARRNRNFSLSPEHQQRLREGHRQYYERKRLHAQALLEETKTE